MVHFAMVATQNPTGTFKTFLLLNPQLSNGGLFLEFYTKDKMMSPEAKAAVVLPDKKPLPSLLSRTSLPPGVKARAQPLAKSIHQESDPEISEFSSASSSSSSTADPEPKKVFDEAVDAEFLAAFEAKKLRGWGHEHMIRVMYLYLTSRGRKAGMDKVFESLKEMMKSGFHYTKTYFWSHMVDYCIAQAGSQPFNTFAEFISKYKQDLLEETLVFKYFEKKDFESEKAATEMILPKKSLPSLLKK